MTFLVYEFFPLLCVGFFLLLISPNNYVFNFSMHHFLVPFTFWLELQFPLLLYDAVFLLLFLDFSPQGKILCECSLQLVGIARNCIFQADFYFESCLVHNCRIYGTSTSPCSPHVIIFIVVTVLSSLSIGGYSSQMSCRSLVTSLSSPAYVVKCLASTVFLGCNV